MDARSRARTAPVPEVPAVPGVRPARSPRGAARPVPEKDEAFAHLGLSALRDYRAALQTEEDRVSYWRRILQARLDVVRAGGTSGGVEAERLRPVLTDARVGAGRSALVQVGAVDDIPQLPSLAGLWERRTDPSDPEATALLEQDLAEAEAQLSAYRAALHQRLAETTGELIARYREQPALCLAALPLRPQRVAAGL